MSVCPSAARAYRLSTDSPDFADAQRVAWAGEVVRIAQVGPAPPPLSESEITGALRAAAAAWSNVECSVSRVVISTPEQADVLVRWVDSWRDEGFDAGAIATTDLSYVSSQDGQWEIVSGTLSFNNEQFRWNTAALGASADDERDVQAVATHELGHILGLLHVCEHDGSDGAPDCGRVAAPQRHTMYPGYVGTSQRELSGDDEAGVCALYPAVDTCAAASCVGAAAGWPCSLDEQCDSRVCSEAGICAALCAQGLCPGAQRCDPSIVGSAPHCVSDRAAFAESCEQPADCASGLCAVEPDGRTFCTLACDSGMCPDGYSCTHDTDAPFCTPTFQEGGNCNARGTVVDNNSGQGPQWLLAMGGLLWIGRRARRGAR